MTKMGYIETARKLARHLTPRRRWQLAGLGVLTLASTFAELVSISAAFPFLAVLADPEKLFDTALVAELAGALGITTPKGLVGPLSVLFCTAILLATAVRMSLVWVQARLSHLIGIDLAVEMFERTLHQPYAIHADRNSARVIAAIDGKSSKIVNGFILPSLVIGNAIVLLASVSVALLIVVPEVGLMLFGGLAAVYGLLARLMRDPIKRNGETMSREMPKSIQALQEGLGGIRDILLDGSQELHRRRYARSLRCHRLAVADNHILGATPRFIVEALGIVLFVVIASRLAMGPVGLDGVLPLLGGLALGAQRLLPIAQQAYNGWTQIRGAGPAIADCMTYLEQPYDKVGANHRPVPLPFAREIRLDGVGLQYKGADRPALQGINLCIPRGTRLGIIGPTGSGKSTLADILMGLIQPDKGSMKVDDLAIEAKLLPAWCRRIAHVPQSIFLTDASLSENVAFGEEREHIDMGRLQAAIDRAQLSETVQAMPDGLDTRVGERGVQLSGGQRQRIAIARALYREADVIIFDEATSALDTATEALVMEAVAGLDRDLTLVMIAHRLTTLKGCDRIVELSGGRIVREGVPADMLE
jgi:ABC-type multidrug transport system fused ATPase/permease subunit